MAENLGECLCSNRSCAESSMIRKDKRGFLYLYCNKHGVQHMQNDQDYILDNGRFYDAEGRLSATPATPKKEPVIFPKPDTKKSWTDDLL